MQETEKLFSILFLDFWILDQLFNTLKKKMTHIAYVFPKLKTAKGVVRQISKKFPFIRPYDKQHGKRSKTLLKSAREDLC